MLLCFVETRLSSWCCMVSCFVLLSVWTWRLCMQLNKPSQPPTTTETAPLSPGEVYYKPTGGEPATVTNTKPCLHRVRLSGPNTPGCRDTVVVKLCVLSRMSSSVLSEKNVSFTLTEPGRRGLRSAERRRRPSPGQLGQIRRPSCQRPGFIQSRAAARQHLPWRELRVFAHVCVALANMASRHRCTGKFQVT